MDVLRDWEPAGDGYYHCGPFRIFRDTLGQGEAVIWWRTMTTKPLAVLANLTEAKSWLKTNWRELKRCHPERWDTWRAWNGADAR